MPGRAMSSSTTSSAPAKVCTRSSTSGPLAASATTNTSGALLEDCEPFAHDAVVVAQQHTDGGGRGGGVSHFLIFLNMPPALACIGFTASLLEQHKCLDLGC